MDTLLVGPQGNADQSWSRSDNCADDDDTRDSGQRSDAEDFVHKIARHLSRLLFRDGIRGTHSVRNHWSSHALEVE